MKRLMALIRSGFTAASGPVLLLGAFFAVAQADDSAASVAVGGIQLRREANISMEKEVLTISEAKVTVEYEFLNDSDRDITTAVAFPVPPYAESPVEATYPFDDFRLWVEGKEIKYQIDARAKLNGKDYTDSLKRLGIDVSSFGGWDTDQKGNPIGPITKLPKQELRWLADMGLIDSADSTGTEMPLWTVVKTYYWTQTFPAHKILHVRHEYSPAVGFQSMSPDTFDPAMHKQRVSELRYKNLDEACVDAPLQRTLTRESAKYNRPDPGDAIWMSWVDFILTTANSWRTPIKDFTLILDRGSWPRWDQPPQYVSLCWDGPIRKLDATRFVAHATNFVPKKELHVAFFSVSAPDPPSNQPPAAPTPGRPRGR